MERDYMLGISNKRMGTIAARWIHKFKFQKFLSVVQFYSHFLLAHINSHPQFVFSENIHI